MNKNELEEIFNNLLSLYNKPPEIKLQTFSTWRELIKGALIEEVKEYIYEEFGILITDFTPEGFDTDKFLGRSADKYKITNRLREIHKIPDLNCDSDVGAFYGKKDKVIYICPRLIFNAVDALIILIHEFGHATGFRSEESAERYLETRWPYYYGKYKDKFLKKRKGGGKHE